MSHCAIRVTLIGQAQADIRHDNEFLVGQGVGNGYPSILLQKDMISKYSGSRHARSSLTCRKAFLNSVHTLRPL